MTRPNTLPKPIWLLHIAASVIVIFISYLILHKMSEKKPFERLPKDVIPTNYKLRLQPDLEKYTFSGNVVITVQVSNLAYDDLSLLLYLMYDILKSKTCCPCCIFMTLL